MAYRSCPDCGANVLLSAAFCKSCGCRIANALVACSHCSTLIPAHSRECPHCAFVLDDKEATKTLVLESVEETPIVASPSPSPPTPQSKEHRSQWRLAGVICGVTLLLTLGAFAYNAYRNSESETLAYSTAIEERDLARCENFLKDYPNSHHSAEIRTLIAELKNENKAWENAKTADKLADYQAFIKQYPQAHTTSECQEAIDSIVWHTGTFQLTRDALVAYQSKTTNPRYQQWAKHVLSRYDADGVGSTEQAEITQTLSTFFAGMASADFTRKPARYAHFPLTRFFGTSDASTEDVTAYVQRMRKEHSIFVFKSLTSVRKERLADGGFRYVALCSVERVTNGSRKGYATYVHLTPHYKIKSVGLMNTNFIPSASTEEVTTEELDVSPASPSSAEIAH